MSPPHPISPNPEQMRIHQWRWLFIAVCACALACTPAQERARVAALQHARTNDSLLLAAARGLDAIRALPPVGYVQFDERVGTDPRAAVQALNQITLPLPSRRRAQRDSLARVAGVQIALLRRYEAMQDSIGRIEAALRLEAQQARAVEERADRIFDIAQEARCPKATPRHVRGVLSDHRDWDDRLVAAVACGRIGPGMTKEMVLAAWGRPDDVNRTVTRFGVSEQWVFGEYGERGFVYFEGDVVDGVQN